MTNWAVRHIDIILWAIQVESPKTVVSIGGKLVVDDMADSYDTIQTSWDFSDFIMTYQYRGFSLISKSWSGTRSRTRRSRPTPAGRSESRLFLCRTS